MTVNLFADKTSFSVLTMPSPDKKVSGAYVGDLLSWVMGKAEAGNVWITIMSNVNVCAVASLTDCSCILLAEGVRLDDDVLSIAKDKGINILSTELSAFEASVKIAELVR